jgi:outer membrane biosynthesis protein TonB
VWVANDWLAAQHATHQRRFVHLLAGSFAVHVACAGLLAFSPAPRTSFSMREVLRVDLVGGLPAAAGPTPVARPPAPAPPKIEPKKTLLPKQAPKAVPRKRAPPPPQPRAMNYDDALSKLRADLGESAPTAKTPSAEALPGDPLPAAELSGTAGEGVRVDAEIAAWQRAVKRHLQGCWITPPEFLNRALVAGVRVTLTSGGEPVGTPEVVRQSGDPYFDENAVRAVMACAPLPEPPQSGAWSFAFTSEER